MGTGCNKIINNVIKISIKLNDVIMSNSTLKYKFYNKDCWVLFIYLYRLVHHMYGNILRLKQNGSHFANNIHMQFLKW